jgi:hypothetical protein
MVTLLSWLVSNNLVLYNVHTSVPCLILTVSLHIYHVSMYCSFASIGHPNIMWSIISSNCWHCLNYYYYHHHHHHHCSVRKRRVWKTQFMSGKIKLKILTTLYHFHFQVIPVKTPPLVVRYSTGRGAASIRGRGIL